MKTIPQMVVQNGDLLWQHSSKKPLNKQTGNRYYYSFTKESHLDSLISVQQFDGDSFRPTKKNTAVYPCHDFTKNGAGGSPNLTLKFKRCV